MSTDIRLETVHPATQFSAKKAPLLHRAGEALFKKALLNASRQVMDTLREDPSLADLQSLLTNGRDPLGNIERLLDETPEDIALHEDYAFFFFFNRLRRTLYREGALYECIGILEEATSERGHYPESLYYLSLAYEKTGDIQKALATSLKAQALRGDDPKYRSLVLRLLLKNGDAAQAHEAAQKALSLDPRNADFHFRFSLSCERMGQLREATAELREAIALEGDNPHYHHRLGNLLLRQCNLRDGAKHLHTAAELAPHTYRITEDELRLRSLILGGRIAVIAGGFRCYTIQKLSSALKFNQPSMPFDWGFFPPHSIVSILNNPTINLSHADATLSSPCIKSEQYLDQNSEKGIRFQRSSYADLAHLIKDKGQRDLNRYLDGSCAYYTLDATHQYVLAHYNWHEFANVAESRGVHSPEVNIRRINDKINKRIRRMFDLCESADHVFFITYEHQDYKYMMIDDTKYDLHDFADLSDTLQSTFQAQSRVVRFSDADSAGKLLSMVQPGSTRP
ncbi:tetratricopeptide repeat protein [Pseudodesulfovibrio indicus]|uniref:tetratricopeptide repeat protein n=1 Tax=Pseudodesulfovibrio indicus TaxID=1716143 RepID=UPI00292CFC96|nr:tetratricopeptide repeat protein [Pseudodesulfovibrio indicus]